MSNVETIIHVVLDIAALVLENDLPGKVVFAADDPFESVGVDSVVMIEIVHRLRQVFECDLALDDALDAVTARQLAHTVAARIQERCHD